LALIWARPVVHPKTSGKGEIGMPRMSGRRWKTAMWTLAAVVLVIIIVVVVLFLEGTI
jgi:hypothetical protein